MEISTSAASGFLPILVRRSTWASFNWYFSMNFSASSLEENNFLAWLWMVSKQEIGNHQKLELEDIRELLLVIVMKTAFVHNMVDHVDLHFAFLFSGDLYRLGVHSSI